MAKHSLYALAATCIIVGSGIVHPAAAVDFPKCFDAIRNGEYGTSGGVNIHGQPVQNISEAVGITYDLCIRVCGRGPEPFNWSNFSRKFSVWLLPWLALISQLPFGAKHRLDNLTSMLLAVGSPTLASYSLTLTILNGKWVARRFSGISYPNAAQAFRILNSLQQAPLWIRNYDCLLSSLVVLPENDEWWSDFADRLDYTHTWSISASTAIAWVFTAYIFTVIDAFTSLKDVPEGVSDGPAVGSVWLWLLPVVVGWLQISPKCDSRRLENALRRANTIAYVATPNGSSLAGAKSEARALSFHENDDENRDDEDAIYDDEECTAPIFNYARYLPWTQDVEVVVSAFRSASRRAERHEPVDNSRPWHVVDKDQPVHADNRRGSLEQVEVYCAAPGYVRRSYWGPNVLSRFVLASFVALALQWGTAGAAIVILWYTPTVGLGCRSLSFLIYATLSTLVWIFLVASSFLTHYFSQRHRHLSQNGHQHRRSTTSEKVARLLAIVLRKLGKLLATCNAVGVVLVCVLQFGNFYNRCYCNSCVNWLGSFAYDIFLVAAGDVKTPWIGGTTFGCGCVALFVFFVNIFINPDP